MAALLAGTCSGDLLSCSGHALFSDLASKPTLLGLTFAYTATELGPLRFAQFLN
jgi:hypothetical protein